MTDIVLDLGFHPVLLGAGATKRMAQYAPRSSQAFVVHQSATCSWAKDVRESLRAAKKSTTVYMVEIADGEKAKDLSQIQTLYEKALDARLERSDAIFAVGGGTVGDSAGFFAATYLRGLPLVHVPTTLLSQVDSSIGGKTGVNIGQTKNMVGVFYQPRLVVDDTDTLASLPDVQITNGLAEVIKYGLILDADFFSYLENNLDKIKNKEPAVLQHVVQQSVQFKGAVVARDEHETHERMKLNYGHTLGHGIETTSGLPHGYAISVGMHAAGIIAEKRGLLNKEELSCQNQLLQDAGLPLYKKADANAVMEKVLNDKKRANGKIRMVLLDKIGSCRIAEVTESEAQNALQQVLQ